MAWLPWRCSRAGCSCRRCTAARSEAAGSHRRGRGSSPPPAPTCPDVCTQDATSVQAEQSVSVVVGGGAEREREPWGRAGETHRTMASIFFLYVGLISLRYSGLISMAAKPKAEFFRPARWHSITAEVKMGTTSTHKHKVSFLGHRKKATFLLLFF